MPGPGGTRGAGYAIACSTPARHRPVVAGRCGEELRATVCSSSDLRFNVLFLGPGGRDDSSGTAVTVAVGRPTRARNAAALLQPALPAGLGWH
jgi:hypothetical protein